MWNCIEYLNDPYLVVKVQKFYGIRRIDPKVHEENRGFKNCTNKILKDVELVRSETNTVSVSELKSNKNGVVLRSNKFSPSDNEDSILSSESETETKNYVITNWFWYYLFVFGTELGDEIFYATFIPFWFWNIDGAVGRRVVMVWTIIMYIGQGIKDIVCWPRPASPPVFRLQKKWAQEYGMPSTHAMVGVSIPFSVVLYTINRYQYPLGFGLLMATLWCSVMCLSRIYLGMHSVLDVVAGLLLALVLMVPVVPIVNLLDHLILTSKWSPILLLIISISLIVYYPKGKGDWTPTRGDTTLVISVCVGVLIGAWTNYQLGEMHEPTSSPPYNVIWPSYGMVGLSALRTVIGMCCIVGTRALCKSVSYAALCYITKSKTVSSDTSKSSNVTTSSDKSASNNSSINNHNIISNNNDKLNSIIELCHKYFTYIVLGFITLYLLPKVFRMLRIERPTFYTEI